MTPKPDAAGIEQGRDARRTKTLILETALKIASLAGIEGLTIGELAKAVGMSKSGLFAHFRGKDNLQMSVLQEATGRFIEAVMKPAFREPRGVARIQALFDNWIEHLNGSDELPGGSVLIAASIELDDRPGVLRDFVQQAQRDLIGNLEKAARMAVEEGQFRKDLDVELFAWSMYSFVLGYHHFKRMLEDPKAERHVRRSFKGLLEVSKARPVESAAPRRTGRERVKTQIRARGAGAPKSGPKTKTKLNASRKKNGNGSTVA